MAGNTEFTTATGNDYDEHERTYAGVMKVAKVGTAAIVLIVISLMIGGTSGAWLLCGLGVVLAIVGLAIGSISKTGTVLPIVLSTVLVVALWYVF